VLDNITSGGLRLLKMNPKPDGIFYFNDFQALVGMQKMHEMGVIIPDDIAVVGFDDIDAASLCYPELTTIRQNDRDIGTKAAELWLEQVGLHFEKRKQGKTVVVPVELIRRATT